MDIKICDTHNDYLTELESDKINSYIDKCKNDNVEIICSSYWSSHRKEEDIKKELKERKEILKGSDYLLHIEDLWWVKNRQDLEFLLNIKPFSCSLTWNGENSLAGGCGSSKGLSKWGREVLGALQENGIILDIAHLNRKSFIDVTSIIKDKIYSSHSAFYSIKKHRRNLLDREIEKIIKSEGFIGLFFYDKCLKKGKSEFVIADIVKSLNYFISKWGYDNIGIGSDFYGIENYPKGLMCYRDFDRLYLALKDEGYSEKMIEKIFYKNFKDFLIKVKKRL